MRGVSAKDVDGYLASIPEDARAALGKLRETIRAAVPEATEVISYQVPTFKYRGDRSSPSAPRGALLVLRHQPDVVEAHAADLEGYVLGKGSIQFPAARPLPSALVKKLVKARIAENEAAGSGYEGGRAKKKS
jgi:uncharacterized protein YdhG (YjbR/CyaY superfamily)